MCIMPSRGRARTQILDIYINIRLDKINLIDNLIKT